MSRAPRLTADDREFCRLRAIDGFGPIEAARAAYGWMCEHGTREYERAKKLSQRRHFAELIRELSENAKKEADAEALLSSTTGATLDEDALLRLAYLRLQHLRDSPNTAPQSKFNAVEALQKLHDPSQDVNLIWSWITLICAGMEAHCPACHETFPLAEIHIPALEEHRKDNDLPIPLPLTEVYPRRLALISKAERRIRPHPGQRLALSSPERHIVGLGAARAGKSFCLAMFSYLYFLQPGSETWLLARTYDAARSEREYLQAFIKTAFYPYGRYMVEEHYDAKSGEWTLTSRWGSEVKIKSAIAKGTITARELDAILVAEPGWVDESVFHQIVARLTSRLGRIIALGTPQGLRGLIARLVFTTGRDPKTGKVHRFTKKERLIENGCDWNVSTLIFDLKPQDNPAYVKSEQAAARRLMGDEEYDTEFEGKMVAFEGLKFYEVRERHLQKITRPTLTECRFVLGVDQGPKNFGACILAWDGTKIYVVRDFFESSHQTIKSNMSILMENTPLWLRLRGGVPGEWRLTIFDSDPSVLGILDEFEADRHPWPTPVTFKNDNKKHGGLSQNWRKETAIYLNEMAKTGNLIFDLEDCSQLHDEVMRVENIPDSQDSDSGGSHKKGWKISGCWRQDHVLDAFLQAAWTILSDQLGKEPVNKPLDLDPLQEAKKAYDYNRLLSEKKELAGFGIRDTTTDELFEETFGRKREGQSEIGWQNRGFYDDY